jgi:hypothetical protein
MDKGKPWMAGVGLLVGAVMAAAATMITREPGDRRGAEEQPPGVRERMSQDSPKRQLRQQLRSLAELDRDPAVALDPAQATQLLALLKPWSTKSKMTEEEAGTISRSVEKVMTAEQLKAMAQIQAQSRTRFGGPGGPGGRGGPGGPPGWFPGLGNGNGSGPPGAPGYPPPFDPARMRAMRDANVLSTRADPDMPWSSRRVEANRRLIKLLETRGRTSGNGGSSRNSNNSAL